MNARMFVAVPVPDADGGEDRDLPTAARSLWRLLLEERLTDHAILLLDVAERIRFASASARAMLGYRSADLVGQSAAIIFTPDDRRAGAPQQELDRARTTGRGEDERWHVRKDGTTFWGSGVVHPLRDDDGNIVGFAKVFRDLTDRQEAAEHRERLLGQLAHERAQLRAVLEHIPVGVVIAEAPSERVVLVNEQLGAILGDPHLPIDDVADLERCAAFHLDGRPYAAEERPLARALRGESVVGEELIHRGPPNAAQHRILTASAAPIRGSDGRVTAAVLTLFDVTEQRRAEELARYDAVHDKLTGLANRALLFDHLQHAIAHVKRCPDERFALLFLDLDRFKLVNDSLGHVLADHLLVQIGGRLQRCVRPEDVVARLGGDEFTILLQRIGSERTALDVADRIHRELARPFRLDGHEVFTGTSIGIALGSQDTSRAEDVVRDADLAMYQAKAEGRGRTAVFDPGMHARVRIRLQLDTDLRHAIERGQLRAQYQPIVDVRSGRLLGFEALLRWQRSEHELLPPSAFIAEAEENGLIVPIGQWIVREACRQLRAWEREHPAFVGSTVSVNLSAKQCEDAGLAGQIDEAVRAAGIAPSQLVLEITESVAMGPSATAATTLARLRAMGVQLFIDDFGVGYSSLSRLRRLPITALKVDRSFIASMEAERHDAEVVRTIIALGHTLGLRVVAEGVESAAQLARLKTWKCDAAQGFLVAPPLDPVAAGFVAAHGVDRSRSVKRRAGRARSDREA